ncbi:MAG: preprotein translocase subunit SecA, partial [Cyclobacteriaceae bacterium]
MINFLTKGLTKIFGTKSDKDIKVVLPYVDQTNSEFDKLKNVSDDELRAGKEKIKEEINEGLRHIDDQIEELNKKIKDDPNMDIHHKEEIFGQIDKLEEDRNKDLEEILLQVLPRAFAIVKETARRFKEN